MFMDKPVIKYLLNQDNLAIGWRNHAILGIRYYPLRIPEKIKNKSGRKEQEQREQFILQHGCYKGCKRNKYNKGIAFPCHWYLGLFHNGVCSRWK